MRARSLILFIRPLFLLLRSSHSLHSLKYHVGLIYNKFKYKLVEAMMSIMRTSRKYWTYRCFPHWMHREHAWSILQLYSRVHGGLDERVILPDYRYSLQEEQQIREGQHGHASLLSSMSSDLPHPNNEEPLDNKKHNLQSTIITSYSI